MTGSGTPTTVDGGWVGIRSAAVTAWRPGFEVIMDRSGEVDAARFRRDLGEYARLAEVGYEPSVVDPILAALGDLVIGTFPAVRTTTHPVGERTLNVRLNNFVPPARPADVLRDAGLLPFTGHPIEQMLADVSEAVPVLWSVDIAVAAGVQKIWMMFPDTMSIERLLRFPALPDSVRDHADHLTRYGDRVAILGLDFLGHTINVYSQVLTPGTVSATEISALLGELEFAPATDEELRILGRTFNVYRTFSWTSPRMKRVCFPVRCTRGTFPVHLDPVLRRFVEGAPFSGTGTQGFNFYAAYGPAGRYYKVQADYASVERVTLPGRKTPGMLQT